MGLAPLPAENTVSAVNIETGETRLVAELGPYEEANNPDGTDINPNLYGLGIAGDGTIYVADAGGNALYQVAPDTGEFSLFAVVPNLTDLTGATPTAEEEAMQPGPRQAVPTSVAIAPDGTITVVLLSEAWNGPSILDYALDGTYTARPVQLSMIVDATYGPDGALYVSQLTADFSGEMPAPGAVYRVDADGTVTPVVEGLFFPHGIAFHNESGNLFVTTNSIISAPDAPAGMLLRFDGIATPAA
jgi:outer membrane protein assembly factor BamB